MLSITAEQPPLAADPEGIIRVGGMWVTLDTVVEAFTEGLSAEETVQQYPTLRLAQVYGAITYYVNHQGEVDDYLTQRNAEAAIIRQQNEARFDMNGLRARLLARRAEQK
jgi:uncharacterized protein (DUF433 family)